MMGPRQEAQAALFYEFSQEHHVPQDHLLRSIGRFVDLNGIRAHPAEFYIHTGRPSVDPALLIRLLLIGYCFGIRSDNGPMFIATPLQDWLRRVGIQLMHIYSGSHWENGYHERFNGTLLREVLNAEWFHSTKQAQVAINVWLRQYNQIRPHHALNMRPPVPETLLEKPQISGTETRG